MFRVGNLGEGEAVAVKQGWASQLRVRGIHKALLSDLSTENTLGWDKEAAKRKFESRTRMSTGGVS